MVWMGKMTLICNLVALCSTVGGGLKHLLFLPLPGEMIQFNYYFSDGLKPPTSVALGFLRHRHTSVFISAQAYLQAYQLCLNHPCVFEKTGVHHNGELLPCRSHSSPFHSRVAEIDGGEGHVCPTSSAINMAEDVGQTLPSLRSPRSIRTCDLRPEDF